MYATQDAMLATAETRRDAELDAISDYADVFGSHVRDPAFGTDDPAFGMDESIDVGDAESGLPSFIDDEWWATEEAMIADYLASQGGNSQAHGTSYVTTNLNVRTGPSVDCPVLSTLRQNSTITPIYCNADCSWILLSGSGWVSASYVVSPPMELYIYNDIPACAYGSSAPVVEYVQPAPTTARPSCGGGCIYPPGACDIKGNVGYETGEKIYHVPGQAYYYDTVIDTRYGERWFCTEYEAQSAGWRRAYQ